MIDIENETSLHIPIETLTKIHQSLSTHPLELLVVDQAQMHAINKEQRGIDKATDVLSFPFEDATAIHHLGSLVICSDYVQKVAKELKHSEEDEFCLLFIHGLLHLLGYDHETDQGEMRDKEAEIIQNFQLPHSLIIRTQEYQ